MPGRYRRGRRPRQRHRAARFAVAAERLNLAEAALALDREYLWSLYCLRVDDMTLSFPEGLVPGDTATLEARAGYRLGNLPVRHHPALRFDVTLSGDSGLEELTGYGDASGAFLVDVTWPPLLEELTLDVEAGFDWEGGLILWDAEVCQAERLQRTPVEPDEDDPPEVSVSLSGGVSAYSNVYFSVMDGGGERRAYWEQDQEHRSYDGDSPVADEEIELRLSRAGTLDGTTASTLLVNDSRVSFAPTQGGGTLSVKTQMDGSVSATNPPAVNEGAAVAFGYTSVGMTVSVEGAPATFTVTVVIAYSEPLASGSDGSEVEVPGFDRVRDIRDSTTVTRSGVLEPGVHDLAATLTLESGVSFYPLPEYGDLFAWPEEVTAEMEVTITVSQ